MHIRSLKGRLVVIILAIYVVVGALTVLAFGLAARNITENFGRRFAAQHAFLDKSRILTPVEREVALARKLADSSLLRSWCGREEEPAIREQALSELDSYRRVFADHSYFFVVDGSRHYYYNNAQDEFRGHELRYTLEEQTPSMAWYFEAMKTMDDFALHVDSSEQLGLVKVWINVVVKDSHRKLGLAGTGLDLSGFLQEIVQSGEKGVITILVDRRGFLQAHPNHHYMEFNARMKNEAQRMTIFQLLGRQADRELLKTRMDRLIHDGSAVETFDLTVEGQPYLAAATYMKDIDWITLVLVDRSQVIGLRTFAPILVFLLLSLVATLVLVSTMLSKVVVGPLERLTASSQKIAGGDYAIELTVDREDEIGRLTSAFGHMTATVRDHLNHLEEKVRERTEALSAANERLSESNRKVTDSIRYAHLIQESMLPKAALLSRTLPDHFVIYRPRDIVGGDFYAFAADPDGYVIAVADCTGHGVPGAFMTMSAGAILEQVLAKLGPEDPAAILREVNRSMKTMLHQNERHRGLEPLDNGLDMALLRVRPSAGRLRFAGARLALWLREPGGELREFRGNAQSLGYRRSNPDSLFTNHDLEVLPHTSCYLFTDGVLDQPGGVKGYGLGQRRLRSALLPLLDLPMSQQGRALTQLLSDYRETRLQRDDITMLGFRVDPEAGKDVVR